MCEGGRRRSRTAGATNSNDVTGMRVWWWWECGRLAMAKQSYCRLLHLGDGRGGEKRGRDVRRGSMHQVRRKERSRRDMG